MLKKRAQGPLNLKWVPKRNQLLKAHQVISVGMDRLFGGSPTRFSVSRVTHDTTHARAATSPVTMWKPSRGARSWPENVDGHQQRSRKMLLPFHGHARHAVVHATNVTPRPTLTQELDVFLVGGIPT